MTKPRFLLQAQRARAQEIQASFPGWRVWYDSWLSGTWNAYRKGEKPYFGPAGEDGRKFMVGAWTAECLLEQLQEQARIDLAVSA